ncbi:unnamed protein product [Mytilus edulis]|uniref:VLIG-type G domain-containing protein n=1 Tax=Mytilus edulis TaxID=6550 RepID=A0A8S3QSS5_MYTED|nr:unnamed protein product [Mytilus edulis]
MSKPDSPGDKSDSDDEWSDAYGDLNARTGTQVLDFINNDESLDNIPVFDKISPDLNLPVRYSMDEDESKILKVDFSVQPKLPCQVPDSLGDKSDSDDEWSDAYESKPENENVDLMNTSDVPTASLHSSKEESKTLILDSGDEPKLSSKVPNSTDDKSAPFSKLSNKKETEETTTETVETTFETVETTFETEETTSENDSLSETVEVLQLADSASNTLKNFMQQFGPKDQIVPLQGKTWYSWSNKLKAVNKSSQYKTLQEEGKIRNQMVEEPKGLPKLAAKMMLLGQPFEIMDGDVANVPLTWVKAVLNQLKELVGENTAEMKDVLQIAVHAFLRLKLANDKLNLKQSCVFVHQNVPASDANDKMVQARQKFVEVLDEMAKEAADQENIADIQSFNQVIDFHSEKKCLSDAKGRLLSCEKIEELESIVPVLLSKLSNEIQERVQVICTELDSFIEKNTLKDVMIQWTQNKRNRFIIMAETLLMKAKTEINNTKEEVRIKKLQMSEKTKHEIQINNKARELALGMKGQRPSANELEQTFNILWNTWLNRFESKDIRDCIPIKDQIESMICEKFQSDASFLSKNKRLLDKLYGNKSFLECSITDWDISCKEHLSIRRKLFGIGPKEETTDTCRHQAVDVANKIFRKIDILLKELKTQDIRFDKMNEKYNRQHSPKAQMQEYKGTAWVLFQNTVNSRSEDAIAADFPGSNHQDNRRAHPGHGSTHYSELAKTRIKKIFSQTKTNIQSATNYCKNANTIGISDWIDSFVKNNNESETMPLSNDSLVHVKNGKVSKFEDFESMLIDKLVEMENKVCKQFEFTTSASVQWKKSPVLKL